MFEKITFMLLSFNSFLNYMQVSILSSYLRCFQAIYQVFLSFFLPPNLLWLVNIFKWCAIVHGDLSLVCVGQGKLGLPCFTEGKLCLFKLLRWPSYCKQTSHISSSLGNFQSQIIFTLTHVKNFFFLYKLILVIFELKIMCTFYCLCISLGV